MCLGKAPKMPEPAAPPPPPQETKPADINATRRKKSDGPNAAIAGGTLLTGPSGIATNTVATGGGSLLGG